MTKRVERWSRFGVADLYNPRPEWDKHVIACATGVLFTYRPWGSFEVPWGERFLWPPGPNSE